MKILWSVNTLMPQIANDLGIKSSHAISWVDAMSERLIKNKDVTIAIVAPTNVNVKEKKIVGGVSYYLISEKGSFEEWKWILMDYQPDVIHLYGTEKKHNFELLKNDKTVPKIISLQGILTQYERFYYGGIDVFTLIKNITIRDLIRGTVFKGRRSFQKAAKTEREMLNLTNYVEGRTDWDRTSALAINPGLKYFYCPRLLREAFYSSEKWQYDRMEKYSIFVHQGNYPIKGLHFVIEALAILKKKYPSVKLYIAGKDTINKRSLKERLLRNGYSKYITSLISKYDVAKSIEFTGYLGSIDLANKLKKCNVMVIPSAIENSPNSLAEAEVVGIPCVASYVGGNGEMLRDYEDGYLYCYNEPAMMADKISMLFEDRELCEKFSVNEQKRALERHDPAKLEAMLIEIYNDVINDYGMASK